MLGLGFVASMAINQVIHNYGKFKISTINRERYTFSDLLLTYFCQLWKLSCNTTVVSR